VHFNAGDEFVHLIDERTAEKGGISIGFISLFFAKNLSVMFWNAIAFVL